MSPNLITVFKVKQIFHNKIVPRSGIKQTNIKQSLKNNLTIDNI